MKNWIENYITAQKEALDSIPREQVARMIEVLQRALSEERTIFVFGNGGSASNCSHFVTDLGKSASDSVGKRFRVLTLNDNVSWVTALGNDYAYEDIFVRQLQNYARAGDVVLGVSVSGNSPNCVKAMQWAKENGLITLALVGKKLGLMAEIAQEKIVIDSTHYGRVEDAQMGVLHMLCYGFIENPEWGREVPLIKS